MKVLITTDAHLYKTPDGKYWCSAIYGYSFWTRFMNVFTNIRIGARVKNVEKVDSKWKRVDGEKIEIYEIPFYQGPVQLVKKYKKIKRRIKSVADGCDVAIFRLPSPTGQLIWNEIKNLEIPIGIEVVYDLTDDMKDPNRSKILKLITYVQLRFLKKACLSANGVSYVTENAIQKNFPSFSRIYGEDEEHFETFYSTITMNDKVFTSPRNFIGKNKFCIAMSDVAMNSERKGERVFLNTIAILRKKGYEIRGIIIGDGTKRHEFEQLAIDLGIGEYCEFTGLLSSSEEVMQTLQNADIYVFPTVAEGLPRGVLEAMAVGMPVVTSPVGGIPEVIQKDYLAMPTDVEKYAAIVEILISNTKLMNNVSQYNYTKSLEFRNAVLQEKRENFYSRLCGLVNNGGNK